MVNGTELGNKLVEKYELGKKHGRNEQYYLTLDKLTKLEKKIKKESLMGCTREMIIEGIFSRIRNEIKDR